MYFKIMAFVIHYGTADLHEIHYHCCSQDYLYYCHAESGSVYTLMAMY